MGNQISGCIVYVVIYSNQYETYVEGIYSSESEAMKHRDEEPTAPLFIEEWEIDGKRVG